MSDPQARIDDGVVRCSTCDLALGELMQDIEASRVFLSIDQGWRAIDPFWKVFDLSGRNLGRFKTHRNERLPIRDWRARSRRPGANPIAVFDWCVFRCPEHGFHHVDIEMLAHVSRGTMRADE